MKPPDRLSRWKLSQQTGTDPETRPRQDNRKRKFTFFAIALLKKEKNKEMPTLNFLSGFLPSPSLTTFASRAFFAVRKHTAKSRTPFGKLAKEVSPAPQTKTPAKKFSTPVNKTIKNNFVILSIMNNQNTFVMTLSVSLILAVMLSFGSCKKIDVPKETPKCIKKKIKEDSGCLQSVYEYDYRGQKVYYFSITGCPDAGPFLLDEKCDFLCSTNISGSWSGQDTSFCNNFYNERTNEKLIWQK